MTTNNYYIKYLLDDYFWEQAELKQEWNIFYLQDENWKHFEKECEKFDEYISYLETLAPDVIIQ